MLENDMHMATKIMAAALAVLGLLHIPTGLALGLLVLAGLAELMRRSRPQ